MHLAAQYLAAAGISFVEKKADDSHTNLGWSIDKQRLETHSLSTDGDVLALNYNTFSLEWDSLENNASFALDGKTHQQVLDSVYKANGELPGFTAAKNKKYQAQIKAALYEMGLN